MPEPDADHRASDRPLLFSELGGGERGVFVFDAHSLEATAELCLCI